MSTLTSAIEPGLPLPPLTWTSVAQDLGVIPVRSPTLPPATHTNCWVLGRDSVVVVDPASPWPEEQSGLIHALGDRKLAGIFLTHHHIDHCSGAMALHQATGAPIWAHAETATRVELPIAAVFADQARLPVADEAGPWRCLHTPGHAAGHLCLHRESDGSVVAGDMVAGIGTILLEPRDGDLETYLDSLKRLLDLNPTRLLPAHGPVIAPGAPLLSDYINHRHQRTDQIQRNLDAAGRTAQTLASLIYTDLPAVFLPVAARQVLSHLRWLCDRELAQPLDGDGMGAQDRWVTSTPRTHAK